MTKAAAGAIVVLVAGAGLAVVVARRIVTGKSWGIPPMAFSRQEDPFSFWLSLLFPAIFAIGLTLAGIVGLCHALRLALASPAFLAQNPSLL